MDDEAYWEGTKQVNEIKGDTLKKDINGPNSFVVLSYSSEQQKIADKHAMKYHTTAHRVSLVAQPYYENLAINRRQRTNIEDIRDWLKVINK